MSELEPRFRSVPACAQADGDRLSLWSAESDRWVDLNGSARRIWEGLQYPCSVTEITGSLAAEFDAPEVTIRGAVEAALNDLGKLGLVAEVQQAGRNPCRERYLSLLKKAVGNTLYPELEMHVQALSQGLALGLEGVELQRFLRDTPAREPDRLRELLAQKQQGTAPFRGTHTMIGQFRLDNIERCAEQIFAEQIEGDFLEAGVCRGGATIFMRALQVAHGASERRTWVVDSFQGVPPSDKAIDRDYGLDLEESRVPWLACSEAAVRGNFSRYDLLDPNVMFVAGWIADTVPQAGIGRLAILRIDVDLYSSTYECLDLLYDKVEPGGFVIVDDYGLLKCCCDAVDEFRAGRGISEPIERIDSSGIFWRKSRAPLAA